MRKFMMNKMMPMMGGTIEKMEFSEKEKMMDQMMPRMMGSMTLEEKMQMMRKMMPIMMKDLDISEMERIMDTMMPTMMQVMKDRGIEMTDMMKLMCPKCVAIATRDASEERRKSIRTELVSVIERI